MNKNKMISYIDILNVTNISIDILNYAEYLKRDAMTKETYELAHEIFKPLRKLFLTQEMYNRKLICVSGLQGAGKTTLMKNFYGISDNLLNPTRGRGERIPVLITEQKISSPKLYAIKLSKNGSGNYERKEIELLPEDYDNASKGEDEEIMYLEIKVPYCHTYSDSISFVLLPGFEKKNDYWNNLIEFAVNSSDAAVFVFNEASFSNANNERILRSIENKFGKNLVYAITGSDGSLDENEEVKQTCLRELSIPENESDRVTCVGSYNSDEKNRAWIEKFKDSLEKYAYRETSNITRNNQYILNEIIEIKEKMYEILDIVNSNSSIDIRDHHNDTLLKAFDTVVKKKRKEFETNLDKEFEDAKSESGKNLEMQFDAIPKLNEVKRLFFGSSIKEQYTQTREFVEKSLQFNDGCWLPARHIGLALKESLENMESKQNSTNTTKLIDTEKNKTGQAVLIVNGERTNALKNDIAILLTPNRKAANQHSLQCENHKKLMGAVAEMAIYYYLLNLYDEGAHGIGLPYYEPKLANISAEEVIGGAEASKKFAVGIAGVMGLDLIGDGTLNFGAQIASSLGIAAPLAGTAATAIIGVGATTVIARDINKMQRDDFNSARMTVNGVYEDLKYQALQQYDNYMEKVRDRLEENLDELDGGTKKVVVEHNIKMKINYALDILDKISERYTEETYGLGSFFS